MQKSKTYLISYWNGEELIPKGYTTNEVFAKEYCETRGGYYEGYYQYEEIEEILK